MSDTKINDRTPLTDKEIALELTRLQMEMVVAYAHTKLPDIYPYDIYAEVLQMLNEKV